MAEYKHARRGRGNAVHAVGEGGQLCGAGKNSIGTRSTSGLRYTDDPITCKTCLQRIEKRAQPIPTNDAEDRYNRGGW